MMMRCEDFGASAANQGTMSMPIGTVQFKACLTRLAGVAVLAFAFVAPGTALAADPEEAYVPSDAPLSDTVTGTGCVIDGDTLMLNARITRGRCTGGTVIHLLGLDAPELRQQCQDQLAILVACGRQSRAILTAKVRGQDLICQTRALAKGPGLVGECFLDGENVNAFMIHRGWAAVAPAAQGRYVALERAAQSASRGIWQLNMLMPWEWRNRPS